MGKPVEVKPYCECGGCGRMLLEQRVMEIIPPTEDEMRRGISGWKKSRYFFRPWGVQVLTRTKDILLPLPASTLDAGKIAPISVTECAHACSRECIDKVCATWRFDDKRTELRAFGKHRFFREGPDLFAFMVGEGAPPLLPSDAWIEAAPPPKPSEAWVEADEHTKH